MGPLIPSKDEALKCNACGRPIPPTAKLATRIVTREQAQLLGIELSETLALTLCLNCRIRLAELAR
jgi:hypothetical protein